MPLRDPVETGIAFGVLVPGLVSEIEERRAAVHNGYTWHAWRDLPRVERVDGVAAYRLDRMIEQHASEASAEHARHASLRRRGGR